MIYKISDGSEKDIQNGDFLETFLVSELIEVLEINENGFDLKVKIKNTEACLSASFITTVWRKI